MQQLRTVLDGSGYSAETIAERLDLDKKLTLRTPDIPVHLRRLHLGDRLDTLIRLLFLNINVPEEEAVGVLPRPLFDSLVEMGFLERTGGAVKSRLRVFPYEDLFFAYDSHELGVLRTDSVLGWTSSARTLASMTVRRQVDAVLDLGTGSGLQALLAARHAKKVVAVDLNPRALWLTELNCRLNGIQNVECREGDMFGPVKGETFDLVVTNPPFVISPSRDYLFRDGGYEGDALSRSAVTGAANVLREGGFAHVMCNWISQPDDPWWARPSEWVDGSGCDALILHYDSLDPLRYAAAWNDYVASDADRFASTLDSWLDYYRQQGIESIGIGAVVLRRRTGVANWVSTAELARGPVGSSGGHIERIFAAQDFLEAGDNTETLLAQSFRLVEDHRLEQILSYRDGAYIAEDAVIVLDDGIGLRNRVPAPALHIVLRMDGSRRLRELIEEAAQDTGLDPRTLTPGVVECVRELFRMGLIFRGEGS